MMLDVLQGGTMKLVRPSCSFGTTSLFAAKALNAEPDTALHSPQPPYAIQIISI